MGGFMRKDKETVMTTAWLELWDLRNKDRHGTDSSEKSKELRDQATREIEILYSLQDKALQKDRNIHKRPGRPTGRQLALDPTMD
jgi:hypothetical protein